MRLLINLDWFLLINKDEILNQKESVEASR